MRTYNICLDMVSENCSTGRIVVNNSKQISSLCCTIYKILTLILFEIFRVFLK